MNMSLDINNYTQNIAKRLIIMDFITLAKNRYSCKRFDSRQISQAQLDTILEAGRLAPTAKNLQEQHIYVAQSAEALATIDQITPCRYGAPTMLIVAYDKHNVYTYPGGQYQSGIEDAAIVTTHMMLAASSVGVDSCWVNCFDPDKMAAAFELPDNEAILACLALGYAAPEAKPLPNHYSRKPLDETVSYL